LTITSVTSKQKLKDYLDTFLSTYTVVAVDDKMVMIIPNEIIQDQNWSRQNLIILEPGNSNSIRFHGKIIDGKANEPLVGARVYFPELKTGDATNSEGQFTVQNVPQKLLRIDIEYVGYQPQSYILGFSKQSENESVSVTLFPNSTELDEVTVTARRSEQNVIGSLSGVETMSIQNLKALPTFLGEVDPIRSITTLPGVSTVGELASGFNVRGGEAGQNLILQDGAPIYNPSHLFGFFSAFNPDLVNNLTLYKGGGPANYGGRVSSVLDITLKNGDDTKHMISGGLGLISSRLAVEGPLVKNRISYLVGARLSYANWLVNATNNIQLDNSSADFYDITGKILFKINENNFVTLSGYRSNDSFKFAADSVFGWSTNNISLKWNHTFNEKWYSALNAYTASYQSTVESLNPIESFTYTNSIGNAGLKFEVGYNVTEEQKITAGLEFLGTLLEPGRLDPAPSSPNVVRENLNNQHSAETSVFIQGDLDISAKLSVSAGLRYTYFMRFGPEEIFIFDFDEIRGRYPVISDTIRYRRNDNIQNYQGLEPRISLRFMLSRNKSLKAGFFRGYQYLHLISNNTSTTPQDYWISSGPYLKPQISDQYSLGYFQNFKDDSYEAGVEGFYRDISNSVDYIEGADIVMNPALEAGLVQGKGLAYGVEFFLKRKSRSLSGWVSYTYSRSLRRFAGSSERITINEGNYYAAAFDQPHRVSVVFNYPLSPRVVASANFNYNTGRPITIPVSKFTYAGYLAVLNYSERNEYRIPDYHRLDLSLTIKGNPHKHHRFRGEWIVSVFNLYGRKNAYSIFFDRYGTAKKLSVLGTVMPSLTYSFKI
jgi:hypothetical protein